MCSERERSFCSLEALGWKLWSLLSDCHCSPKEGSGWGNKLSSMALRGRVRASFGLCALSPDRAGTALVLPSARATQRVCALSAALSSGVLGVLWCSGAVRACSPVQVWWKCRGWVSCDCMAVLG